MQKFNTTFNSLTETALYTAQAVLYHYTNELATQYPDILDELEAKYNSLVHYLIDNQDTLDKHNLNNNDGSEITSLKGQIDDVVSQNTTELALAKKQKKADFIQFCADLKLDIIKFTLQLPTVQLVIEDNIVKSHDVLKNKVTNGDFFEYHIRSHNKTITNIPVAVAREYTHEIEVYRNALGRYKEYYLGFKNNDGIFTSGLIDNSTTVEQLTSLSFLTSLSIGGVVFNATQLVLPFVISGGVSIVDMYETI